jgi:hypothetical protein
MQGLETKLDDLYLASEEAVTLRVLLVLCICSPHSCILEWGLGSAGKYQSSERNKAKMSFEVKSNLVSSE